MEMPLNLAWHGGEKVESERQAWILEESAAALFAKEVKLWVELSGPSGIG
jgi:hypothetical protein